MICNVNEVSQQYAGTTIFESVTFEVKQGERIGLVGRNGSGKTTLMKLLANSETPSSGSIYWKKGCSIGYLEQMPSYSDDLLVKDVLRTVFAELTEKETEMARLEIAMSQDTNQHQLEQLMNQYGKIQEQYLQDGGYEIDSSMDQVAQGLNIAHLMDATFEQLSGGEQTKVGLAMTLLRNPDLLLLDEPTNHLDFAAIEWLEQFISNYTGAVVIISHDRYFLDKAVQKVIDIEDGEYTIYHSNFSEYVKEKEEKIIKEFQVYEEQQRKIKKMKERAKVLREWANRAVPPNPGLHKKARHMERMIERMEKVKKPIHHKQMNLEINASKRSGKDVVKTKGVSKSYGERLIINDAAVHIRFGEKIGLIGNNGAGKSTLLKLLLGKETPDSGEVKMGENLKVGYLSQHLFIDKSDERLIDVFREPLQIEEGQARHHLANFMFYGQDVFKPISGLSGGEKMRLRLAQLMLENINFLVLDEPTNHLDIESRELVEETLENFQGTILAVSHDRYFLDKLFKKIYWIEHQQVKAYEGGYSWARSKKMENQEKEQ